MTKSRRASGRPPAHDARHESTHLAAHAVAVREVAALEHELGDDAVEAGALVVEVLAGDLRLALLACVCVVKSPIAFQFCRLLFG